MEGGAGAAAWSVGRDGVPVTADVLATWSLTELKDEGWSDQLSGHRAGLGPFRAPD